MDYRAEFSKWWLTEFKTVKFPSQGTIFDYYIDPETKKFEPWSRLIPQFEFDPEMPLQVSMTQQRRPGSACKICKLSVLIWLRLRVISWLGLSFMLFQIIGVMKPQAPLKDRKQVPDKTSILKTEEERQQGSSDSLIHWQGLR